MVIQTDSKGETKTAHAKVLSLNDILLAVTELQDDLIIVQNALNSIDTSTTAELVSRLNLLSTTVNNLTVNTMNMEARIDLLEDALKGNTVLIPPVEVKPSFLSITFSKFTNTWK